jgi:hypothetical protein
VKVPQATDKPPAAYAVGEFVPLHVFSFGPGTVSRLRLVSKKDGKLAFVLCFEPVLEGGEQTGWRRTE